MEDISPEPRCLTESGRLRLRIAALQRDAAADRLAAEQALHRAAKVRKGLAEAAVTAAQAENARTQAAIIAAKIADLEQEMAMQNAAVRLAAAGQAHAAAVRAHDAQWAESVLGLGGDPAKQRVDPKTFVLVEK